VVVMSLPVRTHNSEVGFFFDVALVHTWNDPNQGKHLHSSSLRLRLTWQDDELRVARFDLIPLLTDRRVDTRGLGMKPRIEVWVNG
jgi:hypothetical protein